MENRRLGLLARVLRAAPASAMKPSDSASLMACVRACRLSRSSGDMTLSPNSETPRPILASRLSYPRPAIPPRPPSPVATLPAPETTEPPISPTCSTRLPRGRETPLTDSTKPSKRPRSCGAGVGPSGIVGAICVGPPADGAIMRWVKSSSGMSE